MLGCPLATHSETLWLTRDDEHYTRRILLGIVLSLLLHTFTVIGVWFYNQYQKNQIEQTLFTGTPHLPLNVKLLTQTPLKQNQSSSSVEKHESIVETKTKSAHKIPLQEKNNKIVSNAASKTNNNKNEIKTENGNASHSTSASTTQISQAEGVHQTVRLSDLNFRVTPQLPEYPAQAIRRKQQGTVVLLLNVESNGQITQVNIARSSGFTLLDKAAQKAALKWQIYPFTRNGAPISRTIRVPYEFKLK